MVVHVSLSVIMALSLLLLNFKNLTNEFDIEHMVTSPYNSKVNGKVEAAVMSAKKLPRKTAKRDEDSHLGLLVKCNTPPQGIGSSPSRGSCTGGQGSYCPPPVPSRNQDH